MAFAGLKKQINKANQYVTEKMGGAEGTKLDLDFMDMEKKTDVTVELVEELQLKTKEFLQPNPTARAKMAAVKGISKLSGQAKSNTYPQPEGVLGDCMLLYGKKLGEDSLYSQSLVEMGESMKQMADVKYSLDDNIKQNFLEPLHHLQTKDLKEVMHHRKKLQGRRLDFDCKKRRQAKVFGRSSPYGSPSHSQAGRQGSNVSDDEIRQAEEKFAESLHLAQLGMFNLLDNEVEQMAQLASFAEGLLEYHQQCTEILNVLVVNLREKTEEAASRPKMEFVPKTLADLNIEGVSVDGHSFNNGRASIGLRAGNMRGSSHNLSTSSHPPSNLRHSSSIGNLTSNKTQTGWSVYNPNNNNNKGLNDSFNAAWETGNGGASGNGDWAVPRAVPRAPPAQVNRPVPQARNINANLDPWTGGSASSSPVHKPNNLELFPGGNSNNAQRSTNASPLPSPMKSPARTPMVPQASTPAKPCCTALYDFEPENPGELGFKENDIILLINKVDDNWYEGSVNGKTGYFPVSYVQVSNPLP